MKTIYSTDDCGYPLSVIITDDHIAYIKEIQRKLKELSGVPNPSASFDIPCLTVEEHHGDRVYVEISINGVRLEYPGYEDMSSLLDDKFEDLPEVYFSRMFAYHMKDPVGHGDSNKKFMETMSTEHLEILGRKMDEI